VEALQVVDRQRHIRRAFGFYALPLLPTRSMISCCCNNVSCAKASHDPLTGANLDLAGLAGGLHSCAAVSTGRGCGSRRLPAAQDDGEQALLLRGQLGRLHFLPPHDLGQQASGKLNCFLNTQERTPALLCNDM
jgi:hypothetical protein